MDDSLQPTIDMLLNLAVFMWFGAVCPWSSFLNNGVIPIYRLIFLGILILLVRRLPIILAMHRHINQIENLFQASFVGFFGPMGVGAIFYLSISREFLNKITSPDGQVREDAQRVSEAVDVVVWFLVICSIVSSSFGVGWPFSFPDKSNTRMQVVHGLSIPLVKAGYHLPRTISNALSNSTTMENEPISIENIQHTHSTATRDVSCINNRGRKRPTSQAPLSTVLQVGRSIIRPHSTNQPPLGTGHAEEPERPVKLVVTGTNNSDALNEQSSGHQGSS